MNVSRSPAWQALQAHAAVMRPKHLGDLIAADPERLERFDHRYEGLRLCTAFQKADRQTMQLLFDLAVQQDVTGWRDRMFAGEKINITENRAVLHTALRRDDDHPLRINDTDIMPDLRATQKRIADFVEHVRGGVWRGATGKPIKSIVNIGIGGSDLGPRMAALALHPYVQGLDLHFVANVDAFDIENVLAKIDVEETLFVIASKTFTTQETLLNAQTARAWLTAKLGEDAVAKHFVAVSVNRLAVEKFGIDAANMFPMWDWVGGRYSLWSAVGLCLALAIGNKNFASLLAGARAMDRHFQTAPLADNLPVIMACLGVWNRNFLGMPALAVLPYTEKLREMPRYLQQLEMESNGKAVTRDGQAVDYDTVPALFGECGTIGQHSFHQWLHQGSTPIAADFIGIIDDPFGRPAHHNALMSHMVAQIGALAFGQQHTPSPHDVYPGDRPSTLITLDRLDPFHLGLLLALYEHKVFVQGILWNINSFDQPGVELGKRMSKQIEQGTDSSTPRDKAIAALYQTLK